MIKKDTKRLLNKFTKTFMVILFSFYFISIFAGFISPYRYDTHVRNLPHAPPTSIHFIKEDGTLWPYIYGQHYKYNKYRERIYIEDKDIVSDLKFLIRGEKYKFWGLFETDIHLFGFEINKTDGRFFLMGSDYLGRDIFSRIVYGSRISLSIGILCSFITLVFATLFGCVSGYFGGNIDLIIMRVCEILMLIPAIYILFALRVVFPTDLSSVNLYIIIVLILSFISWASLARIIRGLVLNLRDKEFVLASKILGHNSLYIILKHIIPNIYSYLVVVITLSIPDYILAESTLSFLGLGIQDPIPSWGNMLKSSSDISNIELYPWILWPGIFIILTVLSYNIIGDALRDKYDPNII